MVIRIGISGWRYPRWRGDFYPRGLRQADELRYAAERLTAAEINGTFYSLQRPTSFRRWYDHTPPDFSFAVKGSRFITHMKRLTDIDTAQANFWASGVLLLADKLGPLLWQLPPTLSYDAELLTGFFDRLPRTTSAAADLAIQHDHRVPADRAVTTATLDRPVRHALEVRHDSFLTDEAQELCRRHDIALVVADTAGRWPVAERPTSDLVYVRLHGSTELYASGYTGDELDRWADRVADWNAGGHDVEVYFDNDARGRAPHDAVALLTRVRDRLG